MKKIIYRLSTVILALAIGLYPLCLHMPVGAVGGIYEQAITGTDDGSSETLLNGSWGFQTFVPEVSHIFDGWGIKVETYDNPNCTYTANLYLADAGHKPTGSVLSTGSLTADPAEGWKTFSMSYYAVTQGVEYGVVIRTTETLNKKWMWMHSTNVYASGYRCISTDQGATWNSAVADDFRFKEYGHASTGTPSVSTSAATSVTGTTAVLNGNLTDLAGAALVGCYFKYGHAAAYEYDTASSVEMKNSTGTFTSNPFALLPSTTYHYQALAYNGGVEVNGTDVSFTTLGPGSTPAPSGTAPTVTTTGMTHIDNSTVDLYGRLESLGTSSNVTVGFNFGTGSPAEWYFTANTPYMTATGEFFLRLSGLTPGQTYWYQATATGDGIGQGYFLTFVHYSGDVVPGQPVVVTEPQAAFTAVGPSSYNVTFIGNVTSLGDLTQGKGKIRYRVAGQSVWDNSVYADTTGLINATGAFTIYSMIAKPASTPIEYQAIFWNGGGWYGQDSNAGYGSIETIILSVGFTPVPFNVTLNPAASVTKNSAIVSATLSNLPVNGTANVIFGYGVGNYNSPTRITQWSTTYPVILNGTATYPLTGLTPNTAYWYYATGTIGLSNQHSVPEYLTFTTLTEAGTTPGVTQTSTPPPGGTGTPPPGGTGTPLPIGPITLPGSWNTVFGKYLIIIVTIICIPVIMVFVLGKKLGQVVGSVIDVVVIAAGIAATWIGMWEILLLSLTAGVVVAYFVRKAIGAAA